MKLLFISPVHWNFYRYRDQELPVELASRGHACIYLDPVRYRDWEHGSIRLRSFSEHPVPQGVTVVYRTIPLKRSFRSFLFEARDNVRQIIAHRPDAVICTDHLMGVFACSYCKKNDIPFIFDNTDDWGEVNRSLLPRMFWKLYARPLLRRRSFAVTSTSNTQAEYFSKKNKRVRVIPNGKALSFLDAIDHAEVTATSNKVNFIGSLRDWYDFDLMIKVFSKIPELQLNVYGQGELFDHLCLATQQHDNINMCGNAGHSELPALLKESLFGILPLRPIKLNESTCPIKLFDYWAAAKAVIASPAKEVRSLGDELILFASNEEEFEKGIRRLMDEPQLRERLGTAGRERILKKHNYRVIADEFLDVLSS
jgi:glycosyltransferase involved in cell wall biosynthesis